MDKVELKDPQLFLSKAGSAIVEKLQRLTSFRSMENKDILLLAFAFGYEENIAIKIEQGEREKSGFTRERYLKPTENALLKAIAFQKKGSPEVIADMKEVYAMAENYVNGGMALLSDFVFKNPGSIEKNLAERLRARWQSYKVKYPESIEE